MSNNNQPRAAGEAAHMPFPLYIEVRDGRICLMHDSEGVFGHGRVLVAELCGLTRSRSEEFATHIVHACNSHARLTAENKALREALEKLIKSAEDTQRLHFGYALGLDALKDHPVTDARTALASTNMEGR